MGRIKRDTDAGVDGQDELLVALSPVLDDSNIAGRSTGSRHHPLIPFFPHRRVQLPTTHTHTHTHKLEQKKPATMVTTHLENSKKQKTKPAMITNQFLN
jgi:hypothetical protein